VRRPRWPELRAGLIALAIGFGLVEGCPQPQPGYERGWQRGYVAVLRPVQAAILAPVAWVPRELRFSQRWALFQVGARERFRLTVEGWARADGAWVVLYRAGDPAHRELAELLEHRRVQGAWNPTDRAAPGYTRLASWLTARVLAERPELDAVRISHERILADQGEIASLGERWFTYTRLRSAP
jgi:hypothetical protein